MHIGQKLHKIIHNPLKSRGSTPNHKLGSSLPKNIHTKFEANPSSSLRKRSQKRKKFMTTTMKTDTR